ncbi:RagB/SusD family nutrient uptake outer membrane protein [Cellulophaga sp. E16_2]|uniref:RagB/SusD family nutrient uptake outer membrane protein n=1 Tax=Cellulophaga sp. E16_2 TaxID=2789297 RepID=UPI001A9398ED|nr:RagB/SusD family nutrient uptake outer membrane protein [Cellulophaga sp. E16_2]MBO0593207.1 RagB/SusD family nutrient uptake outer membrane protein [Cellulophaga sp. E16_2]
MKLKIRVVTIFLALIFQGCDDQLEIAQNDNITAENLYNTESGALAGLAGAYSRIVSVYKTAIINAQYPTDFTDEGHYNRVGARDIRKNNFTSSETTLLSIWSTYYEGISATNTLLVGLENSTLEESIKQEYIAEGHFIRAFIYFDLQKAFGGIEGIPMPLEETNKQLLPRTAGIDVYKQIIADLEYAELYLPTDAEATPGRAGKGAARGLLARAYLYMASQPFNEVGAYEKSIAWSKTIMDDSYYQLNPSYGDVFDQLAMGNYEKKEMLFQIGFSFDNLDINQSSKLGSEFGMKIDDESCGGKGFALTYATISLILKYRADPSDERGFWNATPYYNQRLNDCELSTINNQFIYPVSKYRRFLEPNNTNTSFGSHHWPVLRFSDVLLMYAEAVNKTTPGSSLALDAINQVRNRANATPLTSISDELIQEERLLELCFEGHRKYDLVRWGILAEKVNETKTIMETLGADTEFVNEDWTSYGEPNLGDDGIPESGDEPTVREIRYNSFNGSFNYFDGYNDFDASKHYILPIPEQELGVNTNIKQTTGW